MEGDMIREGRCMVGSYSFIRWVLGGCVVFLGFFEYSIIFLEIGLDRGEVFFSWFYLDGISGVYGESFYWFCFCFLVFLRRYKVRSLVLSCLEV